MRSGISQHVVKGTHVKQDTAWCRMRFLKYECTSKGVRPKCVWKQHPLIASQPNTDPYITVSVLSFESSWKFQLLAKELFCECFYFFFWPLSFARSVALKDAFTEIDLICHYSNSNLCSLLLVSISGLTSCKDWVDRRHSSLGMMHADRQKALFRNLQCVAAWQQGTSAFSANAVFFFRRSVISRAEMIMMLVNIEGNAYFFHLLFAIQALLFPIFVVVVVVVVTGRTRLVVVGTIMEYYPQSWGQWIGTMTPLFFRPIRQYGTTCYADWESMCCSPCYSGMDNHKFKNQEPGSDQWQKVLKAYVPWYRLTSTLHIMLYQY